jgi:hypothetical protein
MKYVYTAWFKDNSLKEDDPDSTWPACFVIEGGGIESAQAWGDSISSGYANRNDQAFVKSAIEAVDRSTLPGIDLLPVVNEGTHPEDVEIGW